MCLRGQRICGGHNYKKGRRICFGCWNVRTLVEAEGSIATAAARKSSKSVPESSIYGTGVEEVWLEYSGDQVA